MMNPTVDCVLAVKAPLGECPVWCERRQALYWIDIYDGKLNRFDPASGTNRVWRFSEPLGSIALCEDDGVRPKGVDLSDQPLAGSLFAVRPGATGISEPRFKG